MIYMSIYLSLYIKLFISIYQAIYLYISPFIPSLYLSIVRPLIAYTFPNVRVVEGETAELECIVLLGKPKPKLSWIRNGKLLRESSRVRYIEPGRVTLSDVREEDDGEYTCLASNIGGNETYAVNLDVLGL